MFDRLIHKTLGIAYRLRLHRLQKAKDARATVIFIHGLGSSSSAWDEIYKGLGSDLDLYSVDLLGHGESATPSWRGSHLLRLQARSLARTLRETTILKKPIFLVGHSLGSLVATEYAHLYPHRVTKIFLLSSPIYLNQSKSMTFQELFLKRQYDAMLARPKFAKKVAEVVLNNNLVRGAGDINREEDFIPLYDSLKNLVVEQNTFEILRQIETPTEIIYGAFDPLVVGKNIRKLGRENRNITTHRVLASHEISRVMMKQISVAIKQYLRKEQNEK